ncbi:MAG: pilus assembly protein TadG-related protein [Pseudomonadota bacterium]
MMKRFMREERGTVTTFVLVMTVGMVLLAGVAIDFGRSFSAHSQMQAYVDSIALAAANELDRQSDAIERAKEVVDTELIKLSTTLTGSDDTFSVDRVIFLSDQPTNNGAPLQPIHYAHLMTTDPTAATHVLVVAAARGVPWTLLAINADTSTNPSTPIQTAAVATNSYIYCTEPLLAICAPSDGSWENLVAGTQLKVTKNRDVAWDVGEYGIITDISDDAFGTCATYTGNARLECLLAIASHETQCVEANSVSFTGDPLDEWGNDTMTVHAPLNTRFGLYDLALGSLATNSQVPSDINTTTGELFSCEGSVYNEVADTMALPRADCFHDGSCNVVSDVSNVENLDVYWSLVHGGALPAGLQTRYDVYMYEIENGLTAVGRENQPGYAGPSCNVSAPPEANRRRLEVAMIDCNALSGTEQTDVTVAQYAEVFLSESVERSELFVADFDTEHNGHSFNRGQRLDANTISDGSASSPPEGTCRWGTPGTLKASSTVPGVVCPIDASRMPYQDVGLTFSTVQSRYNIADGKPPNMNHPMLFDTANPTGGDIDLHHTQFGHILIVSEDNRPNDPDDESRGSWLIMEFSEPTYVGELTLFDADSGGIVRVYDTPLDSPPYGEYGTDEFGNLYKWDSYTGDHDHREIDHIVVPKMHDGEHFKLGVDRSNVRTIAYFMPESGGVDNIEFRNTLTDPDRMDDMYVEFVQTIDQEDRRMSLQTTLSN